MKTFLTTLVLFFSFSAESGILSVLDDVAKAAKASAHVAEDVPKPLKNGAEEVLQTSPQKLGQKQTTEWNAYISAQGSRVLNHCLDKTKQNKESQETCIAKTKSFEDCLRGTSPTQVSEKNIEQCKKKNKL